MKCSSCPQEKPLPLPHNTGRQDRAMRPSALRHQEYVTFEATGTRRTSMRRAPPTMQQVTACLLLRSSLLVLDQPFFSFP